MKQFSALAPVLLVIGMAAVAGCAHPCGYVDLHAKLTALEGQESVRVFPAAKPLRIIQKLSTTNAMLEVAVEQDEVTSAPAQREIYGRAVYVPYRWYAPFVKPAVSATLVLPFYFSLRDAHIHGGGAWGPGDYFRDAAAWFNPFSGVPDDAQDISGEEQLVSSETITAPRSEKRVPIAGRIVILYLDDDRMETHVTDATGRVRFDIRRHLTDKMILSDRRAALVSADKEGNEARLEFKLARNVMEALRRPAGAP